MVNTPENRRDKNPVAAVMMGSWLPLIVLLSTFVILAVQSRGNKSDGAITGRGFGSDSGPAQRDMGKDADSNQDATPHVLLSRIRAIQSRHQHPDRPCVTLAYAQSLDGKMAHTDTDGRLSSRAPISGPAAFLCTHAMRSVHDGILVGGHTWSLDRPRLTNRIWNTTIPSIQPVPIVLDTQLRHVTDYNGGGGRRVIVCCSNDADSPWDDVPDGMELVRCSCVGEKLDLSQVLHQLKNVCGIESLMVEGGPTVLEAFFFEPTFVDCVALTVSTQLVVGEGVGPYRRPTQLFRDASRIDALPLSDREDVLLLYALEHPPRDKLVARQWTERESNNADK